MGNVHIGNDSSGSKIWKITTGTELFMLLFSLKRTKKNFHCAKTYMTICLQRCLSAMGNSCLSVFLWVLFCLYAAIVSVRGFIKL